MPPVNHWLKSLGTHKDRIPPTGLASIAWITDDIGFPVEPAVRPGDRLVLYASGHGRIFGVVDVALPPSLDIQAEPWSYRVPVRARLVIDDLERAPSLEALNAGSRDVRRSIRQQSHIRLATEEYEAAVEVLRQHADESAGDLVRLSIMGRI
jgi:hypothetical protein